jgi:hypothetical protein
MTALIIVTLAIMLFSGMCIGYVVLYRRNQQLYRNYQILQQTESRELTDVEVFGDDGSDMDIQEEDLGFHREKKKKQSKNSRRHVEDSSDDEDEDRV